MYGNLSAKSANDMMIIMAMIVHLWPSKTRTMTMTTKLTPGDNNDNNGDNNENNYDDDTNNDPDDNDDDPVASDADLLLGGMIYPLLWWW